MEGRGRRPSSVVPSFCGWGQWDSEEGVLVRVEVSIWMNSNPVVAWREDCIVQIRALGDKLAFNSKSGQEIVGSGRS